MAEIGIGCSNTVKPLEAEKHKTSVIKFHFTQKSKFYTIYFYWNTSQR